SAASNARLRMRRPQAGGARLERPQPGQDLVDHLFGVLVVDDPVPAGRIVAQRCLAIESRDLAYDPGWRQFVVSSADHIHRTDDGARVQGRGATAIERPEADLEQRAPRL